MGDRISVVLTRKGYPDSPYPAQHWGGNEWAESVREWILSLYEEDHSEDNLKPANRLEPERVL